MDQGVGSTHPSTPLQVRSALTASGLASATATAASEASSSTLPLRGGRHLPSRTLSAYDTLCVQLLQAAGGGADADLGGLGSALMAACLDVIETGNWVHEKGEDGPLEV